MKKQVAINPIKCPDKVISYWKKEWKVVLMIILSGLIFDGSMSVGPIIQGRIIDMIVDDKSHERIFLSIGFYVAVICIIQFARYLKRFYVRVFANRTNACMRLMVYNDIMNRDIEKVQSEKIGDLMTKAISDVGACVEGMRKFTTEIFDTGVLMLSYFVTMLIHDVKITLLACVAIPIAMFLAEKLKHVIYKYSDSYRKQISKVSNMALENVENQLLFRVNSVDKIRGDRFYKEIEDLQVKSVKANMLENSMQPIYNAISMIGVLAIVYVGGGKVIDQSWTIGQFSAYMTIFIAFAVKAAKAAKLFNSVHKAQISWRRVKPFLHEYQENEVNQSHEIKPAALKVSNLAFRAVKNSDFQLKAGQIIGVTGPVASGKSSIGMVLQGLYDYEGSITINEEELRDIPKKDMEELISYMGHSSNLLSDTIYNNVTLGRAGDIAKVLEDVSFDIDLKSMEEGIDTIIGSQGVRLSGGQQARIALARTLYNKASILVLDDPFSAVDTATEEKIIGNLRANYSDCAILLISHRVAFFSTLDGILFVENGETVFGTHEELMKASEGYTEIYNTQMGGGFHEK